MQPPEKPESSQQDNFAGDASMLNQVDVPKKWSEFQQLKSMLAGLGFLIVSPLIGYAFYQKGNHQAGKLVGGIGIIFGLIVFIGSWISFRQLRSAEKKPKNFSQFQSSTAAEYSAPNESTSASAGNESIIDWLGPVIRIDKGAIGHTTLSHEVVKQAENTLLFTPTQIIALMLTTDDTQGMDQGVLGKAAFAAISYSPDSAVNKSQDMRILYQNHWDKLVANIQSRPIDEVLQSHFNYSIPYSQIASFEVKSGFLNPGFIFMLTSGDRLRFAVHQKNKLKEIASFLERHVQNQ